MSNRTNLNSNTVLDRLRGLSNQVTSQVSSLVNGNSAKTLTNQNPIRINAQDTFTKKLSSAAKSTFESVPTIVAPIIPTLDVIQPVESTSNLGMFIRYGLAIIIIVFFLYIGSKYLLDYIGVNVLKDKLRKVMEKEHNKIREKGKEKKKEMKKKKKRKKRKRKRKRIIWIMI